MAAVGQTNTGMVPYTGGGNRAMPMTGPTGAYANQGAGTVGQVGNGFQQFVEGGSQMLGSFSQGGGGGGGAEGGGSIPPMPPFKSSIVEKAKAKLNEPVQQGEGRDSTGWKKLGSIFDDDGSGGGDAGGGGEE